jgi:hypothetical protein
MRTGKIALLSHAIREQLNVRLHNNNRPVAILQWLNALPETKALIAEQFEGRALTKQNLSEWRHGGFRDWLTRQEARDFFDSLEPASNSEPDPNTAYITKLLRWLLLQYAASATAIADDDDPLSRWSRLRELCADVARLRRSDLYSQFLDIERHRLALDKTNTIAEKEKQFHAWAKREDILAKLKAEEVPGGLTDEAIKEITEKLNLM